METIGELPLERLVLACGLGMCSQVVAEGQEENVSLSTVLYDVDVMRVGNTSTKGVAVLAA